jgi:ABC-2 type transport system ATP-binding protein
MNISKEPALASGMETDVLVAVRLTSLSRLSNSPPQNYPSVSTNRFEFLSRPCLNIGLSVKLKITLLINLLINPNFAGMSVSAQHLTKIYGSQKAVDNVSLDVRPGEILGFLGPNGAGKSTTMKMLTGFLPATEGAIQIAGIDMIRHPLEGRRHIGYLPESNPLYFDMYVREYLAFVAGVYGLKSAEKEINKVVEMTGLGPEQHKIIRQLSKGYKQRVGLAQALIHDPAVLILDEPTTGFDPIQLADIRSLIKSLGKNKTIIFSTHIMQEVQAVCNRVMIIHQGKLVADDTVDGLSARMKGTVSVQISFDQAIQLSDIEQLGEVESAAATGSNAFMVSGLDAASLKRALFHLAIQHNNPIMSLQEEKADLEDIFKSLTQTKP